MGQAGAEEGEAGWKPAEKEGEAGAIRCGCPDLGPEPARAGVSQSGNETEGMWEKPWPWQSSGPSGQKGWVCTAQSQGGRRVGAQQVAQEGESPARGSGHLQTLGVGAESELRREAQSQKAPTREREAMRTCGLNLPCEEQRHEITTSCQDHQLSGFFHPAVSPQQPERLGHSAQHSPPLLEAPFTLGLERDLAYNIAPPSRIRRDTGNVQQTHRHLRQPHLGLTSPDKQSKGGLR